MILAFVGSNPATPARQDSLAQPVEHRTFNAMVRGSNPRWVTSKRTAEAVLFAYPSGMRTPQGFGGCHADACGNKPPCTHAKLYPTPQPDCALHLTAYTRWVTSKRTAEAVLFAYPSGMRTPQGFGGCHADACGNKPPCTHAKLYPTPQPDCALHLTAYTRWVTSKRTAEAVLFAYPSGMRTPQGFGGCHADACGNGLPCTHVKPYHVPQLDCALHLTAYSPCLSALWRGISETRLLSIR